MINDKKKYLVKNVKIFAVGNIASKLIVFFLVPLYTACLSTAEYGTVDLLFTISTVVVPILTLNMSEAIYRFSMDKDSNTNKIVSIGFLSILSCAILGLIFIPIINVFPLYSHYKIYFYFYMLSSACHQIFMVNLKGQEKLKEYMIGNFICILLIALFNILFLLVLKKKIEGYFVSYIISYFITSIYGIVVGKVNIKKFTFDKVLYKSMAKYSIVLIPTSFMWWIINSSDRIMISSFIDPSANGIYAISYKIPSILTTIATIFNQAWLFSAVKNNNDSGNNKFTNIVFKHVYIIMFIIAIMIITFLKIFFKFYVKDNFYNAWKYVPFLLFGSVFVTLATFLSTYYNVNKNSKGFLYSGLFGAILNILSNFILIPLLGVFGAAIATCISYISVFVYRYFDTRKYIKITLGKEFVIPILLMLCSSILLYINSIYSYILQIIILLITIFVHRKYIFVLIANMIKKNYKKDIKK